MKNTMLLIGVVMLCMFSIANGQSFSDYVFETRGDTVVINDFNDMGGESSSLVNAVSLDASAPAGRVYMLKANGYYPLASNLSTPSGRDIIIVGDDERRLVTNDDAASAPPVICGSTIEGGTSNTGGINFASNLTVKNASIIPAASDGTLGWAFFGASAPNMTITLENDLFEKTKWVMVQSNDAAGTSIYISDCYFVNLTGHSCRRNGGVYDNVNNNTDVMWVENSTHVMAEGMMYKFRNYPVGKVVFNHNTFVNCSGQLFETLGYQSNMSIVNNVFVNSNVQPYCTGLDAGETDADNLPSGIVNVDTLTSVMTQLDRKILVERNAVYWDTRLNDMVTTLNTNQVNGAANWSSQMIKMNTRTKALFDDNAAYPYLTEGVWYDALPTFTDSKNLLTDQVDVLKAFSVETVDTQSTNIMPAWRLVNSATDPDLYIYADWPIQVDLSYNDAALLTGGIGGFPVGDLNWFPTEKAAWLAQRTAEYAKIETALNAGTTTVGVDDIAEVPVKFRLSQNYPNPFNPTTKISFTLPHSANVSLKVVDILGREVATIVNGFTAAGSHEVQFNAENCASGIYFYKLTSGDFTEVKKMMLVK